MEDSFWLWVESLQRSYGLEDRGMDKEGHLGTDNGAHHVLPGWGKHPDEGLAEAAPANLHDEDHQQGVRPKARIGTLTHGQGSVWFDPDLPSNHLPNAHMAITGESGSGKTQAMKTILADIGVPALILDFKDDYAEKGYASKEGFSVYDPTQRPLPFNPLEPSVDPQTGQGNKTFHTYQLVEILGRIYHLGELQQHNLREAIMGCYVDAGDATPTFDQVKVKLEAGKGNGELLGHLAPIFDFGFFSDPDPTGFAQIAAGNTVIRLAQLPGNEVKNSVAEFFLMALYNYLVRLEQTHLLRQVLVLDEAWRVVNSPFLEPLMREARAFGLGVFVATQFPTDLPLAVSGSAATSLYFSQSNPDQVTEIERAILGQTGGTEAMRLGTTVRAMLPLQVIVHNKQYEPYVIANARPYYARGHEVDAKVAAEVEDIYQELSGLGLEPKAAMARIRPDRLPANLKNTIETFRDNPNVHVLNDPYCAAGRCGEAAWAFREHARQHGHEAEAIDVTSPAYREGGGRHVVVKVDNKHYVDWTARQFHPKSEVPRVYNALTGDVDSTGFSEEKPADEHALTENADYADVDFGDHPYTFPDEDDHGNAGFWDKEDVRWKGNGPSIERQFNWWHTHPDAKTGKIVVAATRKGIDHVVEPEDGEAETVFDFEDGMPSSISEGQKCGNPEYGYGCGGTGRENEPNSVPTVLSDKMKAGLEAHRKSWIDTGSKHMDPARYEEWRSQGHPISIQFDANDKPIDSYYGHDRDEITAPQKGPCYRCAGKGFVNDSDTQRWENDHLDILHGSYGIDVKDLKGDLKDYQECSGCNGMGTVEGDKCRPCKGSGLVPPGHGVNWDEAAKRLNKKGLDTMNGDSRFQVYDHPVNCDYDSCECMRPKGRKTAQEVAPHDLGMFVCTRCGTGTTSQDGTCADCKEFVRTFADPSTEDLADRIQNAKTPWTSGKTAEMQKFPPGEEDDSPFAPFSTSEWQMVKGPKKRTGLT